jgi:leucyl aminopeptidase (aminopeptidase T)
VTDAAGLERAAHNILARSLGLRRDQHLLIFADPHALAVADAVVQEAEKLGVSVSVFYVPTAVQAAQTPAETLPLPMESAIRETDAVLSCLSDEAEHITFRLRVLRTTWGRRTKLAHCPGMDLMTFRMADTDYGLIGDRCLQLAHALLLGQELEIVTYDARDQVYRLRVELDGRSYPPGITDGIIPEGAWANLPPGETYIVPRDGNGRFAVNGSLPGRVMAPGESIILNFREGRLADIEPHDSPAVRHLQRTQIAYAEGRGDPNWSNLAEIGFGLNSTIKRLTGIEVLDEKMSHTIHVALGHSVSLGGDVESAIHCDMIARDPTVTLDGKPILDRGQWRLNVSDWRQDCSVLEVPRAWRLSVTQVRRSGKRDERDNGRLLCTWNDGRGRWNSVAVGSDATARLAARLYDLLPESASAVTIDDLTSRAVGAGLTRDQVMRLLWLLRQYDLVRCPGEHSA